MAGIRQERLAALLQKEIGSLLQQESSLRFGGHFITVTTVRLTPDLSLAQGLPQLHAHRVGGQARRRASHLVQAEAFLIRKVLAGKVGKHLRKMPELQVLPRRQPRPLRGNRGPPQGRLKSSGCAGQSEAAQQRDQAQEVGERATVNFGGMKPKLIPLGDGT